MPFAAVHESENGPEPTCRNVCCLVANGGKADVPRTSLKDRLCPRRRIRQPQVFEVFISRDVPPGKPRALCRAMAVELAERTREAAGFKWKTIIAFVWPLSSGRVRCRPKSKQEACTAIRPNRSPVFHDIIARLELRRSPQRRGKRITPRLEPVTRWR